MCGKLLYVVFAILGLLLLDNYSTFFALVACGLIIYFYIQIFSKGVNKDRLIAALIIKIWGGFSYFFLLWKHLILVIRNILCGKNNLVESPKTNFDHCGESICLEKEIDTIVLNISQYYLHSWYDRIGSNEEFILRLNSVIKETLIRLCSKVTEIDRKKISYGFLQIYLHFFIHFIDAKKKTEFKVEDFEMKHWASQDSMTEWCYLQSLVSQLIDNFGPISHQNSLHSKTTPILHNFIVEILTEHILHPLSNLLSDPSRLNSWLLKVLEIYVHINENCESDYLNCGYSPDSVPNEEYNSGPKILLEGEESSNDDAENMNKKWLPPNTLSVSRMSSQCDDVNESEASDHSTKLMGNPDCLSPFISSSVKSSSNINLLDSDLTSKSEVCSPISCDTSTIKRSKSADYIRQMPQLRALNVRDYNIMQSENKMFVALKSDLNSSGFIEQAEEAVEVPTLFSDVRINDTVQQSEVLPYTLYCIQYSGVFHDTGKSTDKPHFIKQEVSIRRRFREFLALQSRLEDNPSLKNYLKGIKGPSKWLALPFSNMDKKNIAERKNFLENYLKELCCQAPIAQSSELQEFLAYGGDATVAFVKKAADISVPRIDKMFVRGVKGAFDIFKTSLPNSAVEEGCSSAGSTTAKPPNSDDSAPEHKFSEHLLEYSSREPEIRGHLKHYFRNFCSIPQSDSEKSGSSDDFPQRASMLRYLYKLKIEKCCSCSEMFENDENFALEENPFGNTVIDLLIESLKFSQFSCFHLFTVMKLLVSPSIDRYLVSKLDEFSEHHLAILLHILHKALWPESNPDDDSTKAELKCSSTFNKVQQCLKVLITTSNVTMNINCIQKLCLEQIYLFLASFQHQQLNRCLLFHMFDLVIETVCSTEN